MINANRWGWFNGPVGPGSYYFDIYAGAGQVSGLSGNFYVVAHAVTCSTNWPE